MTGYFISFGYLVFKSYEHFQTYRWLGDNLEVSQSTMDKFKELFPLDFELIQKLKQTRNLSFNIFGPTAFGLGVSFLYPWYFKTPQLHHISTQTAFTRGFKVIYFSVALSLVSALLPFFHTYYTVASKQVCEDTTFRYQAFCMSQKDKDWSKKMIMSRSGIKPHPYSKFD